MNKNIIKKIIVGLLLSLTFSFTIQAQEMKGENGELNDEEVIILLPPGQNKSTDTQNSYARGSIISTAFASISNEGGGKIEILLETLAHHHCNRIRHIGYLERWVDLEQDYEQVARYEFDEYAEDHPGESFTGLTSVLIVEDQPAGYYYRLRGTHKVYADDGSEGFSTRTDGVMITK